MNDNELDILAIYQIAYSLEHGFARQCNCINKYTVLANDPTTRYRLKLLDNENLPGSIKYKILEEADLLEDFNKKIQVKSEISESLAGKLELRIFDREMPGSKTDGPLFSVTPVGFSADASSALLVRYVTAHGHGKGEIILLKKIADSWEITEYQSLIDWAV